MHIIGEFSCKKLQTICDPYSQSAKTNKGFNPWCLSDPLDKNILQDFVSNKIEAKQVEGHNFFLPEIEKAYHYARIAYFVNNGWEDPILLKFGTIKNDYWPNWIVINGNHRYCAAIFLNIKKIFGIIKDLEDGFDYQKFIYNDQKGII